MVTRVKCGESRITEVGFVKAPLHDALGEEQEGERNQLCSRRPKQHHRQETVFERAEVPGSSHMQPM